MTLPASVWEQYVIVAILVFITGGIATAFYKLWRDLLTWITTQDTKRDEERERQRIWMEKEETLRDERWQAFIRRMQQEWTEESARKSALIYQLVVKIDELNKNFNAHDIWARTGKK
jgi:hypothetical protein